MKKVKFGIIGCGRIAERNHIPGLLKNAQDMEITAMYDIKPEKAKALAKQYDLKVKFYKTEEAILASDIDAVIIATPNSCHYPQTMRALAAGKHVLVEKPMSFTPEQADEMIDLSLKQGLVLQVNQSMRFNGLLCGLAKLVADGLIGEVINFRCQRSSDHAPNKGWSVGADWFVDPKYEGSIVGDIAVHMADLLQWVVGSPVKSVMSITRKRDHDVEDNVYALLDFANGAAGMLEQSWTYPTGFWAQEIYGTKGTLRKISGGYEFIPAGSSFASTVYSAESFPALPNSQACFIEAIRTGSKTAWTAGRQAIALVTAIRESGESGKAEVPRNRVEKKAAKKAPAKKAPAKKAPAKKAPAKK